MNIVKVIEALSIPRPLKIIKYSETSFALAYEGREDVCSAPSLEGALRSLAEQKLREATHEQSTAAARITALRAALELDGTHGCDTCDVQTPAKEGA